MNLKIEDNNNGTNIGVFIRKIKVFSKEHVSTNNIWEDLWDSIRTHKLLSVIVGGFIIGLVILIIYALFINTDCVKIFNLLEFCKSTQPFQSDI